MDLIKGMMKKERFCNNLDRVLARLDNGYRYRVTGAERNKSKILREQQYKGGSRMG